MNFNSLALHPDREVLIARTVSEDEAPTAYSWHHSQANRCCPCLSMTRDLQLFAFEQVAKEPLSERIKC